MLLLLHGPAISASRKKLIEIKKKYDPNDVVVFEKEAEISDILASLQTISMFNEDRLVIIENPQEELMKSVVSFQSPAMLVFWFDHEIKKLPDKEGIEILFFPEAREISVFPFLDKLGNKERSAFVEMDKLKKTGFDGQYLITMIFYLLRNLVATPKNAKDFVKVKFAKMRKNFSETELVNLYKFVLATDFKIKSGLLEPDHAEFLLVNKFTG